jgi:hypothetical protein
MPPARRVAQVPQPSCHVIVGLGLAWLGLALLLYSKACAMKDFITRNEQEVIPSQIRVRAPKQILQYTDIYCSYFHFLFKGWFLWLLGLSSMFPDDSIYSFDIRNGRLHTAVQQKSYFTSWKR